MMGGGDKCKPRHLSLPRQMSPRHMANLDKYLPRHMAPGHLPTQTFCSGLMSEHQEVWCPRVVGQCVSLSSRKGCKIIITEEQINKLISYNFYSSLICSWIALEMFPSNSYLQLEGTHSATKIYGYYFLQYLKFITSLSPSPGFFSSFIFMGFGQLEAEHFTT